MFFRQTLTINSPQNRLNISLENGAQMIPFKAFAIVKSAYPKNFVFKAFSVHIKTQGGGFKLSSLKRMFEKFPYELGGFVQMVEFV